MWGGPGASVTSNPAHAGPPDPIYIRPIRSSDQILATPLRHPNSCSVISGLLRHGGQRSRLRPLRIRRLGCRPMRVEEDKGHPHCTPPLPGDCARSTAGSIWHESIASVHRPLGSSGAGLSRSPRSLPIFLSPSPIHRRMSATGPLCPSWGEG
jgi:hypothetical protein